MARPISNEELQLKKRARRRLVGAIVLVTAVAVVLPMVLDSEPKPVSQNVDIHIPSPDSGEFKPKGAAAVPGAGRRPIKIAPDAASKSEAPVTGSKTDTPAPSVTGIADPEPAAAKDAPKTAVKATPTAADTKSSGTDAPKDAGKAAEKEPTPSKDAAAGAYVVQIAALADAAKAKQLEQRMAGTGLKTYTEVVNTQTGEVTRVRAGPYPTRDAAEKARAQLKKAGLDGKVVPK